MTAQLKVFVLDTDLWSDQDVTRCGGAIERYENWLEECGEDEEEDNEYPQCPCTSGCNYCLMCSY